MTGTMRHGDLQVCKKNLVGDQMSDAAYIEDAVHWSKELTRLKTRGPGDLENGMRQIERQYGVDYWTLWRMRYRRSSIKNISVSIYMRLQFAYHAECERQQMRLKHEAELTKAKCGPSHPAVVAAEAVVGADEGQE